MAFNPSIDSTNALTDLDTVNAFLNTDMGDAGQQRVLTSYINKASALCNLLTDRKLKSRSLTEYYSGDGTNSILTNEYPITAITAVYDDLDRTYGSDTEIDSDDLAYLPDGLAYKIVYDGGVFQVGIKNIKAQYTAGYVTIPEDLEQACLEIIAYYFKNSEENRFGVTTRTMGGGSMTIETTDIPKSALRILDRYKRKW